MPVSVQPRFSNENEATAILQRECFQYLDEIGHYDASDENSVNKLVSLYVAILSVDDERREELRLFPSS